MDESFATLIFKDDTLTLIDQRILPAEVSYVTCKTFEDVEFAIRDMIVRGAPASALLQRTEYILLHSSALMMQTSRKLVSFLVWQGLLRSTLVGAIKPNAGQRMSTI